MFSVVFVEVSQTHTAGAFVVAWRRGCTELDVSRTVAEVLAPATHPGAGGRIVRLDVAGPAVHPSGVFLGQLLPDLFLEGSQGRADPYAVDSRPSVETHSVLFGLAPQEPQKCVRMRIEVDAAEEFPLAGSEPVVDGQGQPFGEFLKHAVVPVELGDAKCRDRGLDMGQGHEHGDPAWVLAPRECVAMALVPDAVDGCDTCPVDRLVKDGWQLRVMPLRLHGVDVIVTVELDGGVPTPRPDTDRPRTPVSWVGVEVDDSLGHNFNSVALRAPAVCRHPGCRVDRVRRRLLRIFVCCSAVEALTVTDEVGDQVQAVQQ